MRAGGETTLAFPDQSPAPAGITRREFLSLAAALAAVMPWEAQTAFSQGAEVEKRNGIPYRPLGRTGNKVSLLGVGGYHLGNPDLSEADATRILRSAIDSGVNFMDNCWDYHDGRSEQRMGAALQNGYRQKAFLMTKIDGRDTKTAARQIDESLRRLRTDHLDLLQFHEIIRMNDPERIFAPGGALEAVTAAKRAGKIRYIGFTGHKAPAIHLHMLDVARRHTFHFDTVQMPLNIFDAHFDSFQKQVVPIAVKEGIGILGMKPMGDPFILQTRTATAVECLHWAMNSPASVVITGIDSLKILEQGLQAARDFQPLTKTQIAALLQKTAQAAANGEYEKYKTSHHFDGTHRNPEWLGPGGEQGTPAAA